MTSCLCRYKIFYWQFHSFVCNKIVNFVNMLTFLEKVFSCIFLINFLFQYFTSDVAGHTQARGGQCHFMPTLRKGGGVPSADGNASWPQGSDDTSLASVILKIIVWQQLARHPLVLRESFRSLVLTLLSMSLSSMSRNCMAREDTTSDRRLLS